jgi:acetyl-CoA carboxylase biotin carboxylase subunit
MGMKKKIAQLVNKMLEPVEMGYDLARGMAKKTKESIPALYEEIEQVVKSQLIMLEKDRDLLHTPDLNGFSNVIAEQVAAKLPHTDAEQVQAVIRDTSKKSFLNMITNRLGNFIDPKEYTQIPRKRLFKRVLIANRGEIALRVIRACRELDIETVAIYTKPDAQALAVKFADKSYLIGNNADDYLRYEKIVALAKRVKADAIHPGYGFLSESVDFARLCEKNKIKFIGPSSKSIALMGNKDEARKQCIKLGIPVVAGTAALTDASAGVVAAKSIGFPVIVKAVSGGGGKGMRVVRKEADFLAAFASARGEAEASFGNNELYIEKYVEDPKHIEVQIIADHSGHVVHLGERDCSIQRKHQKLIEETPSPSVDEVLREKVGRAAVSICKAVKYEGAGTVEFLIDKDGAFYFMEMNTRIQVEHGITEMITGIDLIKEQIKIAAGATMAFKQRDIVFDGWAIECRINAESPFDDFAPQTGTIVNYLPPGGPGIRVCSSCHSGHVVSPHYDSLIAKLMCKGKTREEALSRMQRALSEYIIEGVETTIPLHLAVLSNRSFAKGEVTTHFLDKYSILKRLRAPRSARKTLSKEEKLIIVSTAVSSYLEEKPLQRNRTWELASRREQMGEDV